MDVVELFAGVGGFRIGLERVNTETKDNFFNIVWSNQWEPSTKTQHASMIYENKWGLDGHSNQNIEDVLTEDIPDHDMLVGGFPCQDYSVATTLKNSKGILGKKGVLWWSIHRILYEKIQKPQYLLFENVDRLLNSPSKQRGRDFAIMLKCLDDLGYTVEWRVINAAEYGMPQRRRRVFFIGYHRDSKLYNRVCANDISNSILKNGTIANAFPVSEQVENESYINFKESINHISDEFGKNRKTSQFENTGIMHQGQIFTAKTQPCYSGTKTALKDIIQPEELVPEEFYIPELELNKWEYLKGKKSEIRVTKDGFEYNYSEGSMIFPDNLNSASRTIITGEGGKSPSRFKHVIQTSKGLRRLMPIELERLNMFPDNHTSLVGISDTKRAFLMGNALVVGVIERLAAQLKSKIQD